MGLEELFTADKIIACFFFIVAACYFFIATERKKKEIWKAIKGEDNKLQVTEIATLYWCRLFPVLFFLNLMIVILGLELSDNHVTLMTKSWYSMDTFFGFIMLGHGYANRNSKGSKNKE
jgi:hypothetical protein